MTEPFRAPRVAAVVVGACSRCGGPVVALPGLHEHGTSCPAGCTREPAEFFRRCLELKPPCLL